ncbi:MAG: Divalent-cation tolerance protein CutA [Methanonatronarchaeales archaeon]|nr:Divalent-cation tolerance protein CutA [Methanonatronarchaeales archaeon]
MVKGVLVTAPRDEADEIARKLVQKRLAACVNTFDVKSVYRWEGEVKEAEEATLLIKTSRARLERVMEEVERLHSYDLPEILVVDLGGDQEYLEWIRRVTTGTEGA